MGSTNNTGRFWLYRMVPLVNCLGKVFPNWRRVVTPIGGVGGLAGVGELGGLTYAEDAGGETTGLERSKTVGMSDVST